MGYEIVGECDACKKDPESRYYDTELVIKHIKNSSGTPPSGVELNIQWRDRELGRCPVIAVIWDDCVSSYPGEYIRKCIEAYEHLNRNEEVSEPGCEISGMHDLIEMLVWLDLYSGYSEP